MLDKSPINKKWEKVLGQRNCSCKDLEDQCPCVTKTYSVAVATVACDEVLGKAGRMVKNIPSPGEGFEFNSMYNGHLLDAGRGIKALRDLIPFVSEKEHTYLKSVLDGEVRSRTGSWQPARKLWEQKVVVIWIAKRGLGS